MDRTTDLETALSFVDRRIEEQAKGPGHPLNEEEHLLLKNLPSSDVNYVIGATDLGPSELVPRNIKLERLCALAKAAYLNDRKINPESLDWEFAFAVFRLNRHAMWGVLHSAGVKMYRRPLWDPILGDYRCAVSANCRDTPRIERTADHIFVGRNPLRNHCYHPLNLLRFAAD